MAVRMSRSALSKAVIGKPGRRVGQPKRVTSAGAPPCRVAPRGGITAGACRGAEPGPSKNGGGLRLWLLLLRLGSLYGLGVRFDRRPGIVGRQAVDGNGPPRRAQ